MKQFKTLVLENDAWFWTGFEEFVKKTDPDFVQLRPQVDDPWYTKYSFIWFSMYLSQPTLTDVFMQSAFETQGLTDDHKIQTQFEMLLPIVREALRMREVFQYPLLTFHVVYNGQDFIKDLNDGDLGASAGKELSLIMRQQTNIRIRIYNKDHKCIKSMVAKRT